MIQRQPESQGGQTGRLPARTGAEGVGAGGEVREPFVQQLGRHAGPHPGGECAPVGQAEFEVVAAERAGHVPEFVACLDRLRVEGANRARQSTSQPPTGDRELLVAQVLKELEVRAGDLDALDGRQPCRVPEGRFDPLTHGDEGAAQGRSPRAGWDLEEGESGGGGVRRRRGEHGEHQRGEGGTMEGHRHPQ
jgi:hypothetical protein